MKLFWYALTFLMIFAAPADAKNSKSSKGLLPEVRLDSKDENVNEARALSSEVLITQSENQAIQSLEKILRKKKGSPDEADLWYRLAEMYMRRSKSGRFFDLHLSRVSKQLSTFPIPNEKGSDWLKKAIKTYTKIERDFRKYAEMDSVLFNNAFAHQQIGKIKEAQKIYERMYAKFPKSSLVPDTLVALGELYYDQRKFSVAAEFLTKLEEHKDARVFSYGMYKLAWAYYNLGNTKEGVKRLLQVVELSPAKSEGALAKNRQNLRREALRDLSIFIGDTTPANELVMTFAKITKDEELGQAMIDLAKMYEGHSRWKDMDIFLNEFIRREPDNLYLVQAHLYLVSSNEALKKRDAVVEHLSIASSLCVLNSSWRLKHAKEIPDESCSKGFMATAKDIAEKWWEIWLKNKKHHEFTALTEKALKIIIDNENPEQPDLKTHYAYAELLFALERFDEASEQYKMVGLKIKNDEKLKHDAIYAALFAKEKSIAKLGKEKSPLKEGERKDLALNYVKTYPKGQHASEVTFKLAMVYYEDANYDESEKWLKPILEGKHGQALQTKAEDLQLDIFNIRKDYSNIQSFAKKIVSKSKDAQRVSRLTKILEEANYTEIQEKIKSGEQTAAAESLVKFSKEHNKSSMSSAALWQAVGIYFSDGQGTKGADTAVLFVEKNPKDPRALEALKEAAKAYAEHGYLVKAADTLMKIADREKKDRNQNLELAADFYALELKSSQARKIYNSLLKGADKQAQSRIYSKILTTYDDKTGAEYAKLQSQVMALNIEPYATQMTYDRLKSLMASKKYSEAFELARKMMSRDTTPLMKARARLVQAKILEIELVRQSVKSSHADRVALVLGMKTEKLEKAQTAYLAASKISKDPQIQLEAFSGIDRSYANYVESLKNIQLPASISTEDQKMLLGEIRTIVEQIEERRKDNSHQVKKLAKAQLMESSNEWNMEEIGADKSLPPLVRYPAADQLKAYLPANSEFLFSKMKRIEGRTRTACLNKDLKSGFNFHDAMATCFAAKDTKEMEKIAFNLVESKEHRLIGIYYLSLVAELQKAYEKALYFSELAIKSRNDAPLFMYQKARMTYQLYDMTTALPFFEKVLDMQMSSTEMETFMAIKSYNQQDYETSVLKLSKLSSEEIYNLGVGSLLAESYAQRGQVDKALNTIEKLLARAPAVIEFLVQKARIHETFKMAPIPALESYEKAQKLVKDEELKNWLDRKVDLLKNQKQGRAARNFGRLEI